MKTVWFIFDMEEWDVFDEKGYPTQEEAIKAKEEFLKEYKDYPDVYREMYDNIIIREIKINF